ncbi:MAG: hypothetical protein QOF33_2286 [Thermomicrobiales bacterium]|nr:hypothetical protein [Thermomicrobiales bacterium]
MNQELPDESANDVRTHPRLYVLCGLPFSGKSTLARAMEHRLNLVHVEVDRVHAERGLALNGWIPSRGDWIAAYRASYRRLEEALRDGKSVVFDATSYRKIQRRRLRRMADAHRVPTTVVYLDISAQEAQRRRSENQHSPVRAGVSDEDFAMVANEFQTPEGDEEILRYDATLPVDDWIDNVLLSYVGAPSRRDR